MFWHVHTWRTRAHARDTQNNLVHVPVLASNVKGSLCPDVSFVQGFRDVVYLTPIDAVLCRAYKSGLIITQPFLASQIIVVHLFPHIEVVAPLHIFVESKGSFFCRILVSLNFSGVLQTGHLLLARDLAHSGWQSAAQQTSRFLLVLSYLPLYLQQLCWSYKLCTVTLAAFGG